MVGRRRSFNFKGSADSYDRDFHESFVNRFDPVFSSRSDFVIDKSHSVPLTLKGRGGSIGKYRPSKGVVGVGKKVSGFVEEQRNVAYRHSVENKRNREELRRNDRR